MLRIVLSLLLALGLGVSILGCEDRGTTYDDEVETTPGFERQMEPSPADGDLDVLNERDTNSETGSSANQNEILD